MEQYRKRAICIISSILMLLAALPPLFIVTSLYLFGVGWREKRDSE